MIHDDFSRDATHATRNFRRLPLQLAIASAMTVALTACGGGSGGGGNESVDSSGASATNTSSRVASFRRFLDANDIAEDTFEIDYGPTGLVTGITLQEVDDGEPDTANFYTSSENATRRTELSYDADNRLSYSLATSTDANGTETDETTWTYENGLLKTVTETWVSGSDSGWGNQELSYTEGRLTSYVDSADPDDTQFDITYTVRYDAEGKVSALETFFLGAVDEQHVFTWRTDNQLELVSSTEGSSSATLELSYDNAGQLQFTRHTRSDPSGRAAQFGEHPTDENYTLHRIYDERGRVVQLNIDSLSDGSIDGTVVFEWEDGACLPFYELMPHDLPGYVRSADVPYEPGSGISKYPYCSDK
ncbi:MAG: hypothetical protein CME36_06695 [unclassified Hahellaceae]|nr:hypothetical protein [Hahellaceae bacterium]|tara:strand:- start:17769 stop:18854 length:1086 start_codon:yes stop_codon:yes gene_type:complete